MSSTMAQTTSVFTPLSIQANELNSEQSIRYEKLVNNPTFISHNFVAVNALTSVEVDGALLVDLPFLPCPELKFQVEHLDYTDDTHIKWYGRVADAESECSMASLSLLALGDEYIGTLHFNEHSFELFDLTGGVQIICETDLSDAAKGACATTEEDGNEPITALNTLADCEPLITKILVFYTNAAQEVMPNIQNTVQMGVSQINQIYANSDVIAPGTNVVLVGILPLASSVESPFPAEVDQNEINRFANDSAVQALRAQYHADVVILLTDGNYTNATGKVQAIGPIFSSSYAIVEADQATNGRLSFAHEFAHLLGARHDGDTMGTYEHGYQFGVGFASSLDPKKSRSTVMKVIAGDQTRIEHYSNPDVEYMHRRTGNVNSADNARKLRESAPTVASFFTETSPQALLDISVDDSNVLECEGSNLYASVSTECGTDPFTYSWYRRLGASGSWTFISSSATATIPLAIAPLGGFKTTFYKVAVTDALGYISTQTGQYKTYCNDNGNGNNRNNPAPTNYCVSVMPNPTKGEAFLTIQLPSAELVVSELWTGEGKKIQTIYEGILEKGEYNLPIQGKSSLASGVYFIKTYTSQGQDVQKLVITF